MTESVDPWIDYWNRIPEGRLLFPPESDEFVANFLREFRPRPTDQVLDYGCGFGRIAARLAPHVGSVRYWDDAERVRIAASNNFKEIANIQSWNGSEAGFDFVVVNSVVQYLSANELASKLALWAGLLAPGGRIVLSDLCEPGHSTLGDLASLARFSLRRGYFIRAVRNTLLERRRHSEASRRKPPYRPSREEIERFAAAAGLTACYLSRNLTHFRGRRTAVLHRTADAAAPRQS